MPKNNQYDGVHAVERNIDYIFNDKALLLQALTHCSYTNEYKEAVHNERLEFLGDAILQFVATHKLYTLYPNVAEGELSVFRSFAGENGISGEHCRNLTITTIPSSIKWTEERFKNS